jgi:ribosomal-protein-alanine N-acetyltransferase
VTRLQPIAPAHAAVLAALHGEAFPDEPWDPAAIAQILAIPGTFGFLAGAEEGAPEGFFIAGAVGGEIEIVSLAVAPPARRRGIARSMLQRLIELAAGRVLHLEVAEDNAAALALYRSAGFIEVGRRRHYYRRARGAVDGLRLRRPGSP